MSLLRAGWILLACAGVVAACDTAPETDTTEDDGGGSGQGGSGPGGSAQGGSAQGGSGPGGSGQGGTGGSAPCDVECQTLDLDASFGATTLPFERAYYGLTAPANASSGDWEIYVEAYRGGDAGCPTETSATPDTTLILNGHPAPLPSAPLTDGLAATVLDFDGQLLGGPISSTASAASSSPVASDICIDCVGTGPDPDGFVAMDVELSFAEGGISGHIYATHCESLDLP